MFTTGQLVFSIIFIVAFVTVMIVSYRRDKPTHKKHFKGSVWILAGFIVFVLLLLAVKLYLKD